MIQVCSRCGTRWNVRERQRLWCPRCQGALLAPSTTTPVPERAEPAAAQRRPGPRIPQGYRWIAVRPGSAPPSFRGKRSLGPTPRYPATPRWGLIDPATMRHHHEAAAISRGFPVGLVKLVLIGAAVNFGFAAVVFGARYALMLVNRSVLLPPLVADLVKWLGVIAAAFAFLAVPALVAVLTAWLVARREQAYARNGQQDPRSRLSIWLGCLLPFVNLLWAPVFVIETAVEEGRYSRLRRIVVVWWILWVLSTAVSVFATVTSFPDTTQGFADNTLSLTVAYLFALATVAVTYRLLMGFVRKPTEQPDRRWVIAVGNTDTAPPNGVETVKSSPAVESEGPQPAALAV